MKKKVIILATGEETIFDLDAQEIEYEEYLQKAGEYGVDIAVKDVDDNKPKTVWVGYHARAYEGINKKELIKLM